MSPIQIVFTTIGGLVAISGIYIAINAKIFSLMLKNHYTRSEIDNKLVLKEHCTLSHSNNDQRLTELRTWMEKQTENMQATMIKVAGLVK